MIARLPAKPKIERIAAKAKGPPRCSDAAHDDLTLSMNSRPDQVIVSISNLREVMECHCLRGGSRPDLDPQDAGKKYVTVDRLKLFAFMNDHGKLRCDAKEGLHVQRA